MIDRMPKPRRVASRRSFLRWTAYGAVGTMGAALAASAYARFIEPWWIDYSHVSIPVRGLAAALDGLRIAHLTDLHCGSVSLEEVEDWVDKANRLGADLMALTGDYVTGGVAAPVADLAALLGQLKAPLGVVACLGNHDYGAAYPQTVTDHVATGRRMRAALEQRGIEVLVNSFTKRERGGAALHLAGTGDLWSDEFDIDFLAEVPARPLVVLAHNPDTLYSLHYPNFELMLSGHTHGGQVRLPFFGPPRLPIRHRHLAEGHYRHRHAHIYVSRGLGYLTPLRFRARPELGLVELRAA